MCLIPTIKCDPEKLSKLGGRIFFFNKSEIKISCVSVKKINRTKVGICFCCFIIFLASVVIRSARGVRESSALITEKILVEYF